MEKEEYPMRINKYIAHRGFTTRAGADKLISARKITINGKVAELGDKVNEDDDVQVKNTRRDFKYFVYNKPRGVVTHSPQMGEEDVVKAAGIPGVFPVGRLDKDSHGLMILTDDGRITDRLLNPERVHEKEYLVRVREKLPNTFQKNMEAGVEIGDYKTKPCKVRVTGPNTFAITLTEGKKHQIRRMCDAMHVTIEDLSRTRVMNVLLGGIPEGKSRPIEGGELKTFLSSLGLAK